MFKFFICLQDQNENKKRGRSNSKKPKDELPSKKIKYEHTRTCNGEPIPEDQPLLLSGGIMRDYQLQGYQWMSTLYENGINGRAKINIVTVWGMEWPKYKF